MKSGKICLAALAWSLVVPLHLSAARETFEGDRISWTYDTSRLSKKKFEAAHRVSEQNSYYWNELNALELCNPGAGYFECGTHDLKAPYFFVNAALNTSRVKDKLIELKDVDAPPELRPVVQYFERRIRFWIWAEESRLNFYRTWKIEELAKPFAGLDPVQQCPEALRKAASLGGDEAQLYQIARFDWLNCMNGKFQGLLGRYPAKNWKDFLAKYGVVETVSKDEEDD